MKVNLPLAALGLAFLALASLLFAFQFAQTRDSQKHPPTPPDSISSESGIITNIVSPECDILLTTAKETFTLPTQFDPSFSKCDQYVLSVTAPSGQMVAFENLSPQGIDSQLNLFALELGKVAILDDFETFSIFDLKFLPHDQLAVLISQGLSGRQFIRLYDLPAILNASSNLKLEAEQENLDLRPLSQDFVREKLLTDLSAPAQHLVVDDNKLKALGGLDPDEAPLWEIDLASS